MSEKIPATIEDAVQTLRSMGGSNLSKALELPIEKFIGSAHNNIGRWMRNTWGLWAEQGSLFLEFKKLGFTHADDMSGALLRKLYHESKGTDFDIKSYSTECKKYWERNR